MKKIRADLLLCEQGHCATPEEGARLIMAGKVRLGPDHLLRKPSEMLDPETPLLIGNLSEYVSRGAYKLIPALDRFRPSLEGLVALDIGASTGGFTDLMLRRGAEKVYATDVGRGILHGKLRSDPRVTVVEGVNARTLSDQEVPEKTDVVTMDLSFISVTRVLPAADALMKQGAMAFILVKPQFEADRKDVPHGGVVTDERVREQTVEKVRRFAEGELSWQTLGVLPSPIKGPKGNQEYVVVFRKAPEEQKNTPQKQEKTDRTCSSNENQPLF